MSKDTIKKYGLLSGALVAIPIALFTWFFFQNRDTGSQTQISGSNSSNVQVGSDGTYVQNIYASGPVTINSQNNSSNSTQTQVPVESAHEDNPTTDSDSDKSKKSNLTALCSKECEEERFNIYSYDQNRTIGLNLLASNYSKNENEYKKLIYAQRGDSLFFKIVIANNTNKETKELAAYIQIPPGLSYVKGYSKLYYKDAKNEDKAAPLHDYIASADGVMIGSIPAMNNVYLIYKVKVATDAPSGTYSTGNMVIDGSGLKVGTNDTKVVVLN